MLSKTDLIRLSFPPELTQGGISYVCRSLAYLYERDIISPADRLRRMVANTVMELALRNFLDDRAVPFKVIAAPPFTNPNQYDVVLAGHRCCLVTSMLSRRDQITQIRHDPAALFAAPALVPFDMYTSELRKSEDIYLFAFLLGLVAASREDVNKAQAAGQPAYFAHLMPERWLRPYPWIPMKELSLKSECDQAVTIELGGFDGERNFLIEILELPPYKRVFTREDWFSINYVHARAKPSARIGLHSSVYGRPYLIQPFEWINLWIYGMEIHLTGWIRHEDFRRKAYVVNAGTPTFQSYRAPEKCLAVPVVELEPIDPLLERVKEWYVISRV